MIRLWATLAGCLSAVCLLPIAAIRLHPPDDAGLRAFLTGGPCQPPCLLDIHPGETALYEAHLSLQAHAWVERVSTNENTLLGEPTNVSWTWNGRQPSFLRASGRGNVYSHDGILVDEILVESGLPFGDWWVILGPPDEHHIIMVGGAGSSPELYLAFVAIYHQPDMAILGVVECPYAITLWNAQVALRTRVDLQTFPGTGPTSAGSLPRRALELSREIC